MRFLSVCSGIEAASVAFGPLGWECGAVAEIEPFPCAVLHHHYGCGAPMFMPDPKEHAVPERDRRKRLAAIRRNARLGERREGAPPNYGDLTRFKEWPDDRFDGLWGGTPCQSFSVAGLRKGLADPRGNLSLAYAAVARRYRTLWVGWENVPGVLSSGKGEDFRCFLSALAGWDIPLPEGGWKNSGIISAGPEPGDYGLAWRVLDAQYFGVPQLRRRVVLIGHLGDWRPAAAVLFERHCLSGHPAPRREKGQGAALAAPLGAHSGSGSGSGYRQDLDHDTYVPQVAGAFASHAFSGGAGGRPEGAAAAHFIAVPDVSPSIKARDYKGPSSDGDGDGAPLIVHALKGEGFDGSEDGTGRDVPLITAFDSYNQQVDGTVTHSIRSGAGLEGAPIAFGWQNSASQSDSVSEDVVPSLDKSKTPAIAFQQNSRSEVRLMGGDGEVVGAVAAEAGAQQQNYIAMNLRGREGGAMPEADNLASMRAADGGSSRSYIASAPPQAFKICGGCKGGGKGFLAREDGAFTVAAAQDQHLHQGASVRRVMPVECERLQGFPDGYTRTPWKGKPPEACPDGPRYKALGNSWAVPVFTWVGQRIDMVEALMRELKEAA